MTMTSILGKRAFRHGFVLTTTILTCTALQAEHNDQHGNKTEKFVQKAAMGGQMEVQMGQLAQQKGQAQEVKSLGETLVRDHTQANQRLQQLASTKNITLDTSSASISTSTSSPTSTTVDSSIDTSKKQANASAHADHSKHQRELQKLQSQSGTEFDKALVRMAIKDHKKDISEFEHARTDVNDPEIKAFIDEQLPKLRNHLQMAQSAARAVGVDESTIAADRDDNDSAVGSPASSASGTRGSDKPSSPASDPNRASDKDRSSYNSSERFNGTTDVDASGTVHQNNPRASLDANVGDHSVSATADVDKSDRTASADLHTEKDHKVFQKGDGKVLGLSTDKNDGKFLGVIPDPKKKHEANVNADVNVNGHDASVGGSASTETGSSSPSSSSTTK